uniref:hypothetical protein n=1 Tax=Escherichia coli TaxID=562 RepID=UPI003B210062
MTSPDGDKGVNSAFGLQCRAAKEHHALIKSPAWPCDDQKLSVHWRRKTGIQE